MRTASCSRPWISSWSDDLSELVELKVGGLLPDGNNQGSHILLLKIPQKSRYLPIWIGPAEASSIAMVLRGQAFERPLTHDLFSTSSRDWARPSSASW